MVTYFGQAAILRLVLGAAVHATRFSDMRGG
jgi:hypothetical protein